jgi:TPR repeat protein
MRRLRSIASVVALLALTGLHAGCGLFWQEPKKQRKSATVDPVSSEYEKLAAKANEGDVEAAKKLAKWCYVHDTDNTRAKHWLEVAAKHGDTSSTKVADHVREWQ